MTHPEELDVLILGAGLSGINAAYCVLRELPGAKLAILEGRDVVGGTWSFWKYPGFRCDAQMTTFGFDWHPWPHDQKIIEGKVIAEYIEDAIETHGIDKYIRFNHRVTSSNWDTLENRWTVLVDVDGERRTFRAPWVFMCQGYYAYDRALKSPIPGIDAFDGTVVHPQWWPEDLEWAGKKVVIIGSGATAWTLFPTMAKTAGHITVLQRSPSFVMTLPVENPWDKFMKRFLPLWLVHWISSRRDIILETLFVSWLLNYPKPARRWLDKEAARQLPEKYPVDVDFNPKYNPFQQRLCMAADGDIFKALHQPNTEIVTDRIETIVKHGIRTESGRELPVDIIITATGLHVELFGRSSVSVDGIPLDIHDHFVWRGCMLEGVPNAAMILGYVAGTWTPGADATARIFIKTIKKARAMGAVSAMPYLDEDAKASGPRDLPFDATSNYFKDARERLPVSLNRGPWYGRKNIAVDRAALYFGDLTNGMKFEVPAKPKDV